MAGHALPAVSGGGLSITPMMAVATVEGVDVEMMENAQVAVGNSNGREVITAASAHVLFKQSS